MISKLWPFALYLIVSKLENRSGISTMNSEVVDIVGRCYFGISFGVIGLFLGGKYLTFRLNSKSSRTWSVTEGIIIKSKIDRIIGEDSENYSIIIKYEFEVGGKRIKSDTIRNDWFKPDNEDLVNVFPVGKNVNVYYDPQNIKRSIIVKGGERNMNPLLGASLFFIFLGFISLFS